METPVIIRVKEKLSKLGYASVVLYEEIITGVNSETYVLTLEDDHRLFVKSYNNTDFNLKLEYDTLLNLWKNNLPVAQPLFYIDSKEKQLAILVSEFVEGELLEHKIRGDQDLEIIDRLMTTLLSLYEIDWVDVVPEYPVRRDFPQHIYERRVQNAIDRNLQQDVDEILNWLKEHSEFEVRHFSILHGDLHFINIIVRNNPIEDSEFVIIDWDGFDVGDIQKDIAFLLMTTGMLHGSELEDIIYRKVVERKFSLDNIEFYMVADALHRLMHMHSNEKMTSESKILVMAFEGLRNRIEQITGIKVDLEL